MKLLRKLLGLSEDSTETEAPNQVSMTSGDVITTLADEDNLVDGKQTWEHAAGQKDNLDVMLSCCEAELDTMKRAKVVAAPFYFERAAILLRKAKQYELEAELCERYSGAVEEYYATVAKGDEADVRKGPRFQAVLARIPKARELLARSRGDA